MGFLNALLALALAVQAPSKDVDVVHLKDGSIHRGRILSETDTVIRMELLAKGAKGETVGTFSFTIRRKDVVRIERASEAGRRRAEEAVKAFETETARRLAELSRLAPVSFKVEGRKGWRLTGTHFDLQATCEKNIVKEVALSLERVFRAYLRFFDIRHNKGAKVKVLLFADMQQYRAYQVRRKKGVISAPAFYDPVENAIVTFDITREVEKRLKKVEGGERTLRRVHGEVRASMFEALYHEGFHAFASNYLWKGDTRREFPRWLHEGMATYFQMSVVENGRLVHGAAPPTLVKLLKETADRNGLVPLRRLLTATPESFVVMHRTQEASSQVHYAGAMALVHLLSRRMGRENLAEYTSAVMRGRDPIEAFEKLAGKSLAEVERDWVEHIRRMK